MGSCYAKNIKKSPFFKNKLALTQKTPVLTYQTQYTKFFLGIWATTFGKITFDKNPLHQGQNGPFLSLGTPQNLHKNQKSAYNFLLKRKFAYVIKVKVVEKIKSNQMSYR